MLFDYVIGLSVMCTCARLINNVCVCVCVCVCVWTGCMRTCLCVLKWVDGCSVV